MAKLRIFVEGEYTPEDYETFTNENIIVSRYVTPSGNIVFDYKETTELGRAVIDKVEQIDGMIVKAEEQIMIAEVDLQEDTEELAEVVALIATLTPNAKEAWGKAQDERKMHEERIAMSNKTVAGRQAHIARLRARVETLLGDDK